MQHCQVHVKVKMKFTRCESHFKVHEFGIMFKSWTKVSTYDDIQFGSNDSVSYCYRAVLRTTVVNTDMHTCEQFLNLFMPLKLFGGVWHFP